MTEYFSRNIDELIKEKAKAMVDVTRAPDDVRVTAGPGWRDGAIMPEMVCCFYLTWTVDGRRMSSGWIGWN